MTVTSKANGDTIQFNEKNKRWEYLDGEPYYNDDKKVCTKCGKPSLDINNVEGCDFCLQGLTSCDFISNACCGHGDDTLAYIALKDGRRFVLDKMNW